jgi:hypothetical protein
VGPSRVEHARDDCIPEEAAENAPETGPTADRKHCIPLCWARTGPMPSTSRRRSGSASMTSNIGIGSHKLAGVDRQCLDHPDDRYFSMPSGDVGAEVRRNRALNCWPWVRSLTHSPVAVIHSPAAMVAEWPTTVTKSRCPRALVRRTQKPFSALWKVTRSTRPARASCVGDAVAGFRIFVLPRLPCIGGAGAENAAVSRRLHRSHFLLGPLATEG